MNPVAAKYPRRTNGIHRLQVANEQLGQRARGVSVWDERLDRVEERWDEIASEDASLRCTAQLPSCCRPAPHHVQGIKDRGPSGWIPPQRGRAQGCADLHVRYVLEQERSSEELSQEGLQHKLPFEAPVSGQTGGSCANSITCATRVDHLLRYSISKATERKAIERHTHSACLSRGDLSCRQSATRSCQNG